MKTAVVNKIIDSTLIDGPGSRLAIFLQGCNLSCRYCHNPETQRHCDHCGRCVPACPAGALTLRGDRVAWDESRCAGCDTCVMVCPHYSTPKTRVMTVDEVFARIAAVQDFLDGITVSGGECTLQHDFLLALFRRVKAETALTTFIDTNGVISPGVLAELCTVADGFMFDLKALDPDLHRRLTGGDNALVLRNLETVSARGTLYEVRTVVVPGFTGDRAEIRRIAELIRGLNDYTRYKLIPFRPQGVRGELASAPPVDRERFEELVAEARRALGERVVAGR